MLHLLCTPILIDHAMGIETVDSVTMITLVLHSNLDEPKVSFLTFGVSRHVDELVWNFMLLFDLLLSRNKFLKYF